MMRFILKHHECLTDEDLNDIRKLLGEEYTGGPLSVQTLHEIAVLYYESVGIKKLRDAMGRT